MTLPGSFDRRAEPSKGHFLKPSVRLPNSDLEQKKEVDFVPSAQRRTRKWGEEESKVKSEVLVEDMEQQQEEE